MTDLFHTKSPTSFVKGVFDEAPRFSKPYVKDFILDGYSPWAACTGKGVKVCVIDTGVAEHPYLKAIGPAVNAGPSEHSLDINGHATAVAGLIAANDPGAVMGIAPEATLLLAKATNDAGEMDAGSLTASILWAIATEAHVIVISHVPRDLPQHLLDAVAKAIAFSAVVVMDGSIGLPLPEGVLSTTGLRFPEEQLLTCYTDDRFIEVDASDFGPAILGGIAALLIESRSGVDKKARIGTLAKKLTDLLKRNEKQA